MNDIFDLDKVQTRKEKLQDIRYDIFLSALLTGEYIKQNNPGNDLDDMKRPNLWFSQCVISCFYDYRMNGEKNLSLIQEYYKNFTKQKFFELWGPEDCDHLKELSQKLDYEGFLNEFNSYLNASIEYYKMVLEKNSEAVKLFSGRMEKVHETIGDETLEELGKYSAFEKELSEKSEKLEEVKEQINEIQSSGKGTMKLSELRKESDHLNNEITKLIEKAPEKPKLNEQMSEYFRMYSPEVKKELENRIIEPFTSRMKTMVRISIDVERKLDSIKSERAKEREPEQKDLGKQISDAIIEGLGAASSGSDSGAAAPENTPSPFEGLDLDFDSFFKKGGR